MTETVINQLQSAINDECTFPPENLTRRDRRAYRAGAVFVKDWRERCRPIDRNMRAKIMHLARVLEVKTKERGRRNGVVSLPGLQVLWVLLFEFLNTQTGLCCPSYASIRKKTGLCRSAISRALACLELCGILTITRRLVRQTIRRISPITGEPEAYVGTAQTSSLYAIHEPAAYAQYLQRPPARPSPFPSSSTIVLLQKVGKLSIRGGEKPPTRGARTLASIMLDGLRGSPIGSTPIGSVPK